MCCVEDDEPNNEKWVEKMKEQRLWNTSKFKKRNAPQTSNNYIYNIPIV
jgi:hypothetical protein